MSYSNAVWLDNTVETMAAVPWTNNRVWRGRGSWPPVIFSSHLACALSAWVSPPEQTKETQDHSWIYCGWSQVVLKSPEHFRPAYIQTTHKTNPISSLCNVDVENVNEEETEFQWQILSHTHVRFKIQFTAIALESDHSMKYHWRRVLHFDIPCDRLSTHWGRSPWTHSALSKSRTCANQNIWSAVFSLCTS